MPVIKAGIVMKQGTPGLPQSKSLKNNISWTILGNVFYAGCQWGMLIALAKLGSPEMVGRYSLGLAVCAPIILFANMQLRMVQITDTENCYSFDQFTALRFVSIAFSFSLIVIVSFVMMLNLVVSYYLIVTFFILEIASYSFASKSPSTSKK